MAGDCRLSGCGRQTSASRRVGENKKAPDFHRILACQSGENLFFAYNLPQYINFANPYAFFNRFRTDVIAGRLWR